MDEANLFPMTHFLKDDDGFEGLLDNLQSSVVDAARRADIAFDLVRAAHE